MDAYFAAVEMLANPALKGHPLVVGGRPGSRGVVATASYEARRFGIRPGMSIAEAEGRCPQAVFLPGDPPKYIYFSIRLLDLLREFTPLVEPFSIDEAFVDMSGLVQGLHQGRDVALKIQAEIDRRLALSASIGIGTNKLVAKMASGINKPHGIAVLSGEDFRRVFWPLPTGELWGVGEKTAAALACLSIHTIGELASAPRAVLVRSFGVVGGILRHMARGEDETPLIPYFEGLPVKSMGHEHTLVRDECDLERLEALLLRLSEQVARRLRRAGQRGRTVTVKLRFADFRTITRQRTIPLPTDEEGTIFTLAREMLHRNAAGAMIRLLGVSVSGFCHGGATDYLFGEDRRRRRVLGTVDRLRDRFGDDVMTRARILTVHGRRESGQSPTTQEVGARIAVPAGRSSQVTDNGRPIHARPLRSRTAG